MLKKAKLILRNKIILFLTITVAIICYCFYVEPNWIQTNTILIDTKLNKNYKFVQISDVHMKVITFKERWILYKVQSEKPDAIFVTGDLVLPEPDLIQVTQFLKILSEIAPVYTVSGNWEHWAISPNHEIAIYKNASVNYLKNANKKMSSELCIIGLDDYLSGDPNFSQAILGCENATFNLALFHSPEWIDTVGHQIFDFGLAGHTHGGQIRLPFYTPITPPGSGSYVSGFYEKNKNKFYVSRGLGQSVIQARFFARPEIVVIDLISKK